jgi:hypothetical protein
VTGIFPIRLISPHLADDLPTETTLARLTIGKKTLAGGDDCHAETALNTGQFFRAAIHTVTGTRDSLDSLDSGGTSLAVSKHKLQRAQMGILGHLIPVDIALIDEDLGNSDFDLG